MNEAFNIGSLNRNLLRRCWLASGIQLEMPTQLASSVRIRCVRDVKYSTSRRLEIRACRLDAASHLIFCSRKLERSMQPCVGQKDNRRLKHSMNVRDGLLSSCLVLRSVPGCHRDRHGGGSMETCKERTERAGLTFRM